METVKEKIAYLRGMMEAGEGASDSNSRVVLQKMLGVLDDLADHVDSLLVGQEELQEYMEAMDADLSEVEGFHDGEFDDDELQLIEMDCPKCREKVCFHEDFLYDEDVEVSCPDCGEVVFVGEDMDHEPDDDMPDAVTDPAYDDEHQ